ncbi:unnamed protein product, partial [Amoebophrya sp. A25]|eukprot:GSA25T00021251001.1
MAPSTASAFDDQVAKAADEIVQELDVALLVALLGPDWRSQRVQHLDFSDAVFELVSLKIKEHDEDRAFAPLSRSKVISIDL